MLINNVSLAFEKKFGILFIKYSRLDSIPNKIAVDPSLFSLFKLQFDSDRLDCISEVANLNSTLGNPLSDLEFQELDFIFKNFYINPTVVRKALHQRKSNKRVFKLIFKNGLYKNLENDIMSIVKEQDLNLLNQIYIKYPKVSRKKILDTYKKLKGDYLNGSGN